MFRVSRVAVAGVLAAFVIVGVARADSTPETAAAPLTFIEDDYPRALAEAKKRGVPLFVDAWAPWCHTCVFMREHVLNRPELGRHAGDYVFASIDTERPGNAAFVEKFPIESWPTLFVINPKDESVRLRWLGTVTASEFGTLLGEGATGPQIVQDNISAAFKVGDYVKCATDAARDTKDMPTGAALANTLVWAMACVSQAKPAVAEPVVATLVAKTAAVVDAPGLLADDRSSLYEVLVAHYQDKRDAAAVKRWAAAWLTFLEAEAAKAKAPGERTAFDPHRVAAALALGEPARALAAVRRSEKDFPSDYNPFARESILLRELARYDEALTAIDHAARLVYGPRTVRVLELRASIFAARKDTAGQKAALEKARVAANQTMSGTLREKTLARLDKALAALASPAAPAP
jgi:thiol-disulfide isomerase/thioredoxin